MAKKIAMLFITALLCVSFAGCMPQATPTPSLELDPSKADPAATDYDDSLKGLTEYLKGCQLLFGDGLPMSFGFIGAVAGEKYSFKYGEAIVSCELYQFDTANLNETSTAVLNSVKEKGTFTALDKEVHATISDSGKFIMIYVSGGKEDIHKVFDDKMNEKFKAFQGK